VILRSCIYTSNKLEACCTALTDKQQKALLKMGLKSDHHRANLVHLQLHACKGIRSFPSLHFPLLSRDYTYLFTRLTTRTETYAILHAKHPLTSLTAAITVKTTSRRWFLKGKDEYHACLFAKVPHDFLKLTAKTTSSDDTHHADRLLCKGRSGSSAEGAAMRLLESLRSQPGYAY